MIQPPLLISEILEDESLAFWYFSRRFPGIPPIYPSFGAIPCVVFDEACYLDSVMG